MQKINILYVITKLELGGAQQQLLSLICHLDKEKFKPFLFTTQEGLLLQEASTIGGLTLKKSRSLQRAINPLKDLLAVFEIYRLIKQEQIEIVHTHSSKAGILGRLAAKLAGAKAIIHTVHGWSFHEHQSALSRRLFICLERFSGRFTHKIIVVSLYDQEKGIKNRIASRDKYQLIRYGIDYAQFAKKDNRIKESLSIPSDNLVVTNISCFKPQKSPLDFIRLAALASVSFPALKFILVGDGILRKKIEKLITKLNLEKKVILTGWRRDIPEILSATDILVLTSLWEGLPIAVLEAMVTGIPVVATVTGAVAEVVCQGKTGFLVPRRNPQKMSEKLSLLFADAGLREGMGNCARSFLGPEFSTSRMVCDHQEMYLGLIKT